jgi:hypothetical protein
MAGYGITVLNLQVLPQDITAHHDQSFFPDGVTPIPITFLCWLVQILPSPPSLDYDVDGRIRFGQL